MSPLWILLGCTGGGTLDVKGDTSADTDSASCADAMAAFDFEGDEQGFDSDETDDGFNDPWEHGSPDNEDCHSGDDCWGTGLDGEYDNCEAGALVSPVIDLSACAGEEVTLSFWHVYRLEDQSSDTWYDGAMVQVSADGGETWNEVDPSEGYTGVIEGNFSECDDSSEFYGEEGWSGSIGDWEEVTVDLDEDLLTADFRVRFWFASDRGATEEGWFVDDVELSQ
jgi:hypothetical protein